MSETGKWRVFLVRILRLLAERIVLQINVLIAKLECLDGHPIIWVFSYGARQKYKLSGGVT